MPDFIVKKKEQWVQPVYVENAKNTEDALQKVRAGEYAIFDDAEYDSDIASGSWEVERAEK